MNAIAKNTCSAPHEYAMVEVADTDASHGSGSVPCGRHTEKRPEISKFGHGGPRANSGGSRLGAGRKPAQPVPVAQPCGPRWHVVETYGQAERLAASELARRGYTVYLPLIAVRKQDAQIRSRFHKVLVPMFGGYLFAEFDRTRTEWVPILHQPGVRGIIMDPMQRPSPVPDGFVEWLRGHDADRCDLAAETMPQYAPGDVVRMMEGPFTSFPATVLTCDGITTRVNVHIFGRTVAVNMQRADVGAA